jgi:predicted transposase YbfD/YdcC
MAKVEFSVDDITCQFSELEDPRSTINRLHPLPSVLVISIMAILAGATGPTSIAEWANIKAEFLLKLLDLPNGIPQKDVYRRVLCLLKPEVFQSCFMAWLTLLRAKVAAATGITQPVLAVDGKTLRRSFDKQNDLGALHSVTVWASEFGLSLGQVACAEKSNEITAIPELLRLVDISGAIITIDAMGTQKAIAAEIVNQGADYVLALKGNQGSLHNEVINYIDQQSDNDYADVDARCHTTEENAHGRTELRHYVHMPIPRDLAGRDFWKGLKTIGKVVSVCQRDGKETIEVRYFICSLTLGVKRFARAVRSHWGIENSCHWCLDVTFREDESRARNEFLRQNLAWLYRFVLSLLKQHKNKKSVATNRRNSAWGEHKMLEILLGATI